MSLRQPTEVYGSLGKGMCSQVWEVWGVYGSLGKNMGSLCKCRAACDRRIYGCAYGKCMAV